MKTIKDSLHDIIFRSIVVEAKASYNKFDITFDEFCSDKANLELKGEEVVELNKFAQDNNIVVVSKSFKSGFDYAKNYSDKYDYQNIFVVLPFEELNVVFKLKKHKGVIEDIEIFVVDCKDASIKSCIKGSRSAFEYYENLYINSTDNESKIFNKVFESLNKLNTNIGDKFSIQNKVANNIPSPDKSPYTLVKKNRFPSYVRYCEITAEGKDFIFKNTEYGRADIFVQTVVLDGKKYYAVLMGDTNAALVNDNYDKLGFYYLTTLGQLDKFLEFTLKPNRMKKHDELGADGEIHVWFSKMQKNLPANLKKDIIKDEDIIKKCKFHHMDIFDLYDRK